jgi:hypothetical protein
MTDDMKINIIQQKIDNMKHREYDIELEYKIAVAQKVSRNQLEGYERDLENTRIAIMTLEDELATFNK